MASPYSLKGEIIYGVYKNNGDYEPSYLVDIFTNYKDALDYCQSMNKTFFDDYYVDSLEIK